MPHLISANRLTDGRVVFRTDSNSWSACVGEAAIYEGKDIPPDALERARADVAANIVVEIEPVEAIRRGGKLEAVHLRDRIRIAGPSVLQRESEPSRHSPSPSEQPDVSI